LTTNRSPHSSVCCIDAVVPFCIQAPAQPVICCTCGGPIYVDGPGAWGAIREKLCLSLPLLCDPNAKPEQVTREVAINDCWASASTMLDAEDCCTRYGGYTDVGAKENCGQ